MTKCGTCLHEPNATVILTPSSFDYEPTPGHLTVRMPSAIHVFAVNALSKRISDWLSATAEGGDQAAEFAAEIANGGSARISLDDVSDDESQPSKPVRREPDAQFQHRGALYPGVVIEVSYSQDGKSLRKLAYDYILRPTITYYVQMATFEQLSGLT